MFELLFYDRQFEMTNKIASVLEFLHLSSSIPFDWYLSYRVYNFRTIFGHFDYFSQTCVQLFMMQSSRLRFPRQSFFGDRLTLIGAFDVKRKLDYFWMCIFEEMTETPRNRVSSADTLCIDKDTVQSIIRDGRAEARDRLLRDGVRNSRVDVEMIRAIREITWHQPFSALIEARRETTPQAACTHFDDCSPTGETQRR